MAVDAIRSAGDLNVAKSSEVTPQAFTMEGWDPSTTQTAGKGVEVAGDVNMPPLWQRAAMADQPAKAAGEIPEGYRALQTNEKPEQGDLVVIPGRKDLHMTVDREIMRDWSQKPIVRTIDLTRGVSSTLPLEQFKLQNPTALILRRDK